MKGNVEIVLKRDLMVAVVAVMMRGHIKVEGKVHNYYYLFYMFFTSMTYVPLDAAAAIPPPSMLAGQPHKPEEKTGPYTCQHLKLVRPCSVICSHKTIPQ